MMELQTQVRLLAMCILSNSRPGDGLSGPQQQCNDVLLMIKLCYVDEVLAMQFCYAAVLAMMQTLIYCGWCSGALLSCCWSCSFAALMTIMAISPWSLSVLP